jgi:protein gp37
MADKTEISWTEATWNIITGCSLASPGCTNCYAMKLAGTRLKDHPSRAGLTREVNGNHVWTGEVRFNEKWLTQPLQWTRPRMIFVCAHGDLFHEDVPDAWIDKVFAVMALAPQHTFQVLTKRSARMRDYLRDNSRRTPIFNAIADLRRDHFHSAPAFEAVGAMTSLHMTPLPNVWLGVSVEDQRRADERIPDLLATPAAVRWISAEPLLGPVRLCRDDQDDQHDWLTGHWREVDLAPDGGGMAQGRSARLDWVVVGGENGPRPMHLDWARSLRDQCADAGVPFHFKQHGTWATVFDRERDDPDWRDCGRWQHEYPKGRWLNLAGGTGFHGERVLYVTPVGKQKAGRLLDGIEHNAMPEVARG